MPSALVIEDGSIVSGANTYVGLDTARTYAEDRGFELSDDDDTVTVQLFKSMDYLATFSQRWLGVPVASDQPLAWPRSQVILPGTVAYFPEDEIPPNLIAAQCQLVIEQQVNGIDLIPSSLPGLPVIREKVDVIETEYANPQMVGGIDWTRPNMPLVDALLKTLLQRGFSVRTRRI